jgi:hypothetical protein
MYQGKEVCQGCSLSGEVVARINKNNLCNKCIELIRDARMNQHEDAVDYVSIRDWFSGFPSYEFKDKSLDSLANNILSILHNENATTLKDSKTIRSQPLGSIFYKIPISIEEPLLYFFNTLAIKIKDVRLYIEESEEIARTAMQKEKDRIYNEGVEKGKQLLLQLNSGNLTMSEFEKALKYETSI